jgi:homoserine kinase
MKKVSLAFESVTAFAPATVANVGCAFDVLGFALDHPGDTVTVSRSEREGVVLHSIEGDGGRLPRTREKNTALVAIDQVLRILNIENIDLSVSIKKEMPLGSGLGSSAASAVAAALATNHLFGDPLTREQLVPAILEGERIACGAAHADNGAPSLLGGFILIRSYDPLDIVAIHSPKNLWATVVHPHIEIKTEDSRRILRRDISLKNAIVQWGNTAGLIAGLLKEDYGLIGRSLSDVIIEPERALLIPGFDAVKQNALSAGALGCSISGSGPSVFALAEGEDSARTIAEQMTQGFQEIGIGSDQYVSAVNREGARILSAR